MKIQVIFFGAQNAFTNNVSVDYEPFFYLHRFVRLRRRLFQTKKDLRFVEVF
jgi:tRNA U54 and U55 pseudouridine synthase Pus10